MESLKKRITKVLRLTNDTPKSAKVYCDVTNSIFMSGGKNDAVEITSAVEDNISYENLIFNDFVILRDFNWEDAGNNNKRSTVKDGWVFRIFKMPHDKVGVGVYLKSTDEQKTYLYFCALEVGKHTSSLVGSAMPHAQWQLAMKMTKGLIEEVRNILYTTQNFTRTVKNEVPKGYNYIKLSNKERALHVEYTVDLSKPLYVSGESKGGTHASPREHHRRGHYRTSKSGKRYFVNATVVNKGCGYTSDQSYKLN